MFDEHFLKVLNSHALLKKKLLRTNRGPYTSKALREVIMEISGLEKIYFKKRTDYALTA